MLILVGNGVLGSHGASSPSDGQSGDGAVTRITALPKYCNKTSQAAPNSQVAVTSTCLQALVGACKQPRSGKPYSGQSGPADFSQVVEMEE